MPDQPVRVTVVCPNQNHGMLPDPGYPLDYCGLCRKLLASEPGTTAILATLSDPEAEALMADGERWRNLRDNYNREEAQNLFTPGGPDA